MAFPLKGKALGTGHPIIAIWNKRIQNDRRIAKKVHFFFLFLPSQVSALKTQSGSSSGTLVSPPGHTAFTWDCLTTFPLEFSSRSTLAVLFCIFSNTKRGTRFPLLSIMTGPDFPVNSKTTHVCNCLGRNHVKSRIVYLLLLLLLLLFIYLFSIVIVGVVIAIGIVIVTFKNILFSCHRQLMLTSTSKAKTVLLEVWRNSFRCFYFLLHLAPYGCSRNKKKYYFFKTPFVALVWLQKSIHMYSLSYSRPTWRATWLACRLYYSWHTTNWSFFAGIENRQAPYILGARKNNKIMCFRKPCIK